MLPLEIRDRSARARTRCGALGLLLALIAGCAADGSGLSSEALLRRAGLSPGPGLDEPTVAAGLREALRVGTERAVALTSQTDGFWGNASIRIPLPSALEPMAEALRALGLGGQLDALELAMNRSAERASAEATEVFWAAIEQMTLQDAFGILRGGESAATDYFRVRTSDALRARFRPVVDERMQQVGVYRIYEPLESRYAALPFVSKPAFELDGYVTDRALEGLFALVAREERRIREDPAARTSELLRRVFAGSS